MSSDVVKALFFRYLYMLRQRMKILSWTAVFVMIMYGLLFYYSKLIVEYFQYKESRKDVEIHTFKSLSTIPKQLLVVVCPDGPKERQLMDFVERILRVRDKPFEAPLRIVFVGSKEAMVEQLQRWHEDGFNDTRGVNFGEITDAKLEYTIRPHVPGQGEGMDWGAYLTAERFPFPMERGPRHQDSYFDVRKNGEIIPGIIQLQVAIDRAYIIIYISENTTEWLLSSFPYPRYNSSNRKLPFIDPSTIFLVLVLYVMLLSIEVFAEQYTGYIIKDKVDGMRELLSINGAPRWMTNGSWLAGFIVEVTLLAALETLLFKRLNIPIIQYTSSSVLMITLLAWNWSVICLVFLISSISTSQILCNYLIAFWVHTTNVFIFVIPPDNFTVQRLLAILPNAGLVLILRAIQEFDGAETELGLGNIFTTPEHYMSVGTVLIIMLATMVVHVALAFYVDLVNPSPYGRALPWYIFTRKRKSSVFVNNSHKDGYFEEIDSKNPIGLECINIYKFFGTFKAVDNVSMKIIKNQITILLGHNGAGKSTLFSILCGMYSPTHGLFTTDRYDVFLGNNIKRFPKVLGYCPQNNMLQDELTVNQHMVIFGLLKGLSRKEAREYSDYWTTEFDMEDMSNRPAKKLSGGTKRKLSLAIALTGDPKYLLLDEPSSGLDADSVRTFWDILMHKKGDCTVVLTTHNMEEAEFLGDWVACMRRGQLIGHGSTTFLKNKLTNEYKLSCATDETEMENFITAVKTNNGSANIIHRTNRSVTFSLPSDNPDAIPALMRNLDSQFGEKVALSLSRNTMDDVFIKLNKERTVDANKQSSLSVQDIELDNHRHFTFGQVIELFKKRIKWLLYKRLIMLILVVAVSPALGLITIMFGRNVKHTIGRFPETKAVDLKLTLDKYKRSTAVISRENGDYGDALKIALNNSGVSYEEQDQGIVKALQVKASKNLLYYRTKIVYAFETRTLPIAYYSRNAFHSAPIAYSAMMNGLIHGKATIVTHNFPFVPEFKETCSIPLSNSIEISFNVDFFILIVASIISSAVSHFIAFPHTEKQSLFKHLQLMTGLLPLTYWISNFFFDLTVFIISCIAMLAVLASTDTTGLFNNNWNVISALMVVLILYGINGILLAYLCSYFNFKPATLHLLYIFYGYIVVFTYLILMLILLILEGRVLGYQYLYLAPWITLNASLMKITIWAEKQRDCYNSCRSEVTCAMITKHSLFGELKMELMSFVFMAMALWAVLLALEHGLGRKLNAMVKQKFEKPHDDMSDVDPAVAKEKQYVKDLEEGQNTKQPALVCDGLGMTYFSCKCSCQEGCRCAPVVAVRSVTFTTDIGKLFGLLGANGAGKTTTFNMLAGLISPTKGDAIIGGQRALGNCEYKYMRKIGYCPQFQGLLPELSGRTILHLFGLFRWVKPDMLDSHVQQWLEALDMNTVADQPCERYSGGNKRKLSFAVAMIGNPPVVLLDEPTTGIDPIVRRRMWDILTDSVNRHKQAIVLSSHTISECEFICHRLTILVKGDMKCLGSVTKLKNTFGKSCNLHVHLRRALPPQAKDVVQSLILSRFSGHATLLTAHQQHLSFNVKTNEMKIYDAFATMSDIKKENSAIDDFSLAETPLEEIFLMIARGSTKLSK